MQDESTTQKAGVWSKFKTKLFPSKGGKSATDAQAGSTTAQAATDPQDPPPSGGDSLE
jgi:hypothetical protein